MGEIHNLNTDGRRKRKLNASAKSSMAEGRQRSRLVDKYLRELATGKYHRRGPRKTDPVAIQAELDEVNARIERSQGVEKLMLVEERRKLEQLLTGRADSEAFAQLEAEFITIAKAFSDARHISYESWRELGVPARALIKAGIYPPNRGHTASDDDED